LYSTVCEVKYPGYGLASSHTRGSALLHEQTRLTPAAFLQSRVKKSIATILWLTAAEDCEGNRRSGQALAITWHRHSGTLPTVGSRPRSRVEHRNYTVCKSTVYVTVLTNVSQWPTYHVFHLQTFSSLKLVLHSCYSWCPSRNTQIVESRLYFRAFTSTYRFTYDLGRVKNCIVLYFTVVLELRLYYYILVA